MIVRGYSIDLYCENEQSKVVKHRRTTIDGTMYFDVNDNGIFFSFAGETYTQCAKQARKVGWVLSRDRSKAICPICAAQPNGAKSTITITVGKTEHARKPK